MNFKTIVKTKNVQKLTRDLQTEFKISETKLHADVRLTWNRQIVRNTYVHDECKHRPWGYWCEVPTSSSTSVRTWRTTKEGETRTIPNPLLTTCRYQAVSSVIQQQQHFKSWLGATENARPENAGLENDGQLRKESQGLENAGLENDGQLRKESQGLENARLENNGNILANSEQNYRVWKMQDWKMTDNVSQLWAKLRGLENAGLENGGPC